MTPDEPLHPSDQPEHQSENTESQTEFHPEPSGDETFQKPSWKARLVSRFSRAERNPEPGSEEVTATGIRFSQLSKLDPLLLSRWVNSSLQGQGTSFYGKLATVVLSTYFLSNLTALLLENYIPEPPVSRSVRSSGLGMPRAQTVDDYQVIFSRNLFNSRGLIPGEQGAPEEIEDAGGNPVKSSLPLNLIGTVILRNQLRSIATIEDKSVSTVYPVRMDDEIPGKIKILTVEPGKVIFINTSNGRREYIEIPEDPSAGPRITVGTAKKSGSGIEQVAPNQFNLPRAEVDKAMSDINQVLTQARAVPNMENGVPAGYKLFQIVPGSIYDKLGLKNGDTLCGLNGEAINDPARAFALLNELKTSSHLELCVKREGKQSNYTYDIR